MKTITYVLGLCLIISGCNMGSRADQIEKWKQEIRDTEKAFAHMVAEEGLHKAFIAFAADDAVMLRNDELVTGKPAIDQFYDGIDATGLAWEPDHIDVAGSGDLAYTYGHYTYTYTGTDGKQQHNTGIFHTVWKRQKGGSWKFVWD